MSDPQQQDRISILLVKPDGVRDPDKSRAIAESVEASSLKIIERSYIRLDADDIDDIWPKFASSAHAFTRRMLAAYMTSGPCQVLVVESADVIAVSRAVRSRVRRQFGDAAFENALHTPTDPEERAANVAFLTTDRQSFVRHSDPTAGPGRFGRFGDLTELEVSVLVERLWRQRVRYGWEFYQSQSATYGQEGVVLLPGSDNSIDFEISAIIEVFANREIDWSVGRFLEAEKFGSSHIALQRSDAALALARLCALGVKARPMVAGGRQQPDDP